MSGVSTACFEASSNEIKEIEMPSNLGPKENVQWDYMKNRLGFRISETEVTIHTAHRKAWRDFQKRNLQWALFIEDNVEVSKPISELTNSFFEPYDWDVYVPYDLLMDKAKYSEDASFILGYNWGASVYFLSITGVNKLLENSRIHLPVCEEIFQMHIEGLLDIHYEDTGVFSLLEENVKATTDRDLEIRRAILTTNVWVEDELVIARRIINMLTKASEQAGCQLILFAGTLLGYIRHDSIMGWDDDIDFSLDIIHLQSFLQVVCKKIPMLKFREFNLPGKKWIYYKFWVEEGMMIKGYTHYFPFVDIWLYKVQGDKINFIGGEVYTYSQYYPLRKVFFEGSNLYVPIKALECLDSQYKDWRTKIKVFPWSHRLERRNNFSLTTDITVDENGRFLPDLG